MKNPILQITRIDRIVEGLVTPRIFYGWTIVLITFASGMIIFGIGGFGVSFFVIPMSESLGVSRTEFSSVPIFRLVLLPLIPFLGMLVDKKHGPRLMVVGGSIIAGIALMLTSTVNSLWQFYLFFGVIFGMASLTIGGGLVGPAVISKWFIRKRGRAMAMGTMGISMGGITIAPLAGWLVGQYGWRTAWFVLGLVLILIVTPLAALFMRRRPEDINLIPDGDPVPVTQAGTGQPEHTEPEYSWTLRQALKTKALWVLLGVQVLMSMSLTPVLFHHVAYMQDKGYSLAQAATIATTLAFFALIAKVPWGYLVERMESRWLLAFGLIVNGLSLLLLVWAQNIQMLFAYAAINGFMVGGQGTLMNVAWASYFGRQHVGAIRGMTAPVSQVVGSFSPMFAAWTWTEGNSYGFPFLVFSFTYVAAGLLMLMASSPGVPPAVLVEEGEH